MKITKGELRDANLICTAYFDIFQHNKYGVKWKPSMMRIQMWIKQYRLKE